MELWKINLWQNANNICYVERDLLSSLQPLILEQLFKRMSRYTQYPIGTLFSIKNLESLGDDIYELKFHLREEIRYLGCIEYGGSSPVFHALCAFQKKTQKIRKKYINTTYSRKIEFNQLKKHGL
jgi:phage-related protein